MLANIVHSSAQAIAVWKIHLSKLSEAEKEMFLKYGKGSLA